MYIFPLSNLQPLKWLKQSGYPRLKKFSTGGYLDSQVIFSNSQLGDIWITR